MDHIANNDREGGFTVLFLADVTVERLVEVATQRFPGVPLSQLQLIGLKDCYKLQKMTSPNR